MSKKNKVPRSLPADVAKILRELGLPWELRPTSKHLQLVVAGHCVGVLSRGVTRDHGGGGSRHLVSAIRRLVRQQPGVAKQ